MKFIKKNLKWLTIILIFIILMILLGMKLYLNRQALEIEDPPIEELEELTIPESTEGKNTIVEETKKIFVDIKGAILNPGVYEIEKNKKVIDAVNLAGGFTENANTTLINLAKQVKNEMVIIIYTNEEVEKASQENPIIKIIDKECVCPEIKNDACLEQKESTTEEGAFTEKSDETTNFPININTASQEELETLPGIGASKAEAIIEYRNEKGNFQTIEELKEVTGIGENLYEKVKDYITV